MATGTWRTALPTPLARERLPSRVRTWGEICGCQRQAYLPRRPSSGKPNAIMGGKNGIRRLSSSPGSVLARRRPSQVSALDKHYLRLPCHDRLSQVARYNACRKRSRRKANLTRTPAWADAAALSLARRPRLRPAPVVGRPGRARAPARSASSAARCCPRCPDGCPRDRCGNLAPAACFVTRAGPPSLHRWRRSGRTAMMTSLTFKSVMWAPQSKILARSWLTPLE